MTQEEAGAGQICKIFYWPMKLLPGVPGEGPRGQEWLGRLIEC